MVYVHHLTLFSPHSSSPKAAQIREAKRCCLSASFKASVLHNTHTHMGFALLTKKEGEHEQTLYAIFRGRRVLLLHCNVIQIHCSLCLGALLRGYIALTPFQFPHPTSIVPFCVCVCVNCEYKFPRSGARACNHC